MTADRTEGEPSGLLPLRRWQLSDEIAMQLRSAIMTGSVAPGTFIRLDETATRLRVSITPVREALRTLRSEGMVRLEPHRGHAVAPMSRRDIEDIFWLQATLAVELASSAAERITEREIDELERLNHALGSAVITADTSAIVEAEFAFHRLLNRVTGRYKLAWFMLQAARYLPPLSFAADPEWGVQAVDNHRMLVTALRQRDNESVIALTRMQFTDGARRMISQLERSGIWS